MRLAWAFSELDNFLNFFNEMTVCPSLSDFVYIFLYPVTFLGKEDKLFHGGYFGFSIIIMRWLMCLWVGYRFLHFKYCCSFLFVFVILHKVNWVKLSDVFLDNFIKILSGIILDLLDILIKMWFLKFTHLIAR